MVAHSYYRRTHEERAYVRAIFHDRVLRMLHGRSEPSIALEVVWQCVWVHTIRCRFGTTFWLTCVDVFSTRAAKRSPRICFFSSFLMLNRKTTLYISNRFTVVIPFDQWIEKSFCPFGKSFVIFDFVSPCFFAFFFF